MNIQIEIKILDARLREWGLPKHQTEQSAGIDLHACVEEPLLLLPQAAAVLIPTGFAMHMNSNGLCALIVPRSGLGHKKGLVMGNGTGVIDADYTAQCYISAWNRHSSGEPILINPGDRIAQMLFIPILRPVFDIVDSFSAASRRGDGGFGSTGLVASKPNDRHG